MRKARLRPSGFGNVHPAPFASYSKVMITYLVISFVKITKGAGQVRPCEFKNSF